MSRRSDLVIEVWREVCRHLDIDSSARNLTRIIQQTFPIESLHLLSLDEEHGRINVVASVSPSPSHANLPTEPMEKPIVENLAKRIRRLEIGHFGPRPSWPAPFSPIPISAETHESLLVPLMGEHGSLGMLLLLAEPGKEFLPKHLELAQVIQEPLSVAMDNDRRLRELASLREAAEADRRSLLNKLGRSDLADTIVGQASGLKQVMERVKLIERSDVPVLILGETGTGKELIARAIHHHSDRAAGPFIRVNCGAIPPDLIDSQLFGHEKGSFTGATDSRAGWFERAHEGTLFLDEIGELPLDAQVRFLRVLQDGMVERVGSVRSIHVDVRVVAATHRDLAQMVRENKFREDLWYRIAVFPLLMPPLRERKNDIPDLVEHFATRAAARFGLHPVHAEADEMKLLYDYTWPGNIRELGAVIDRAAILGNGKKLEIAKALGFSSGQGDVNIERSAEFQTISLPKQRETRSISTLDNAMKEHIELALEKTVGRIEGKRGAAELLGINPHTLRARMRKLGVQWKSFRETFDLESS